jgi:hypothetical protein
MLHTGGDDGDRVQTCGPDLVSQASRRPTLTPLARDLDLWLLALRNTEANALSLIDSRRDWRNVFDAGDAGSELDSGTAPAVATVGNARFIRCE